MPDELVARLDALGPLKARRAVTEMIAYYQLQREDRARKEWEDAIDDIANKKVKRNGATYGAR